MLRREGGGTTCYRTLKRIKSRHILSKGIVMNTLNRRPHRTASESITTVTLPTSGGVGSDWGDVLWMCSTVQLVPKLLTPKTEAGTTRFIRRVIRACAEHAQYLDSQRELRERLERVGELKRPDCDQSDTPFR